MKLPQPVSLILPVGVIQYPSMAAFQARIISPEYAPISRHRAADLVGQLDIRARLGAGL